MKPIPMLDLRREYEHMKEGIDAAIAACLSHQRWIRGPEVAKLEERMARYLGVEHCVGVASGTDALAIALRALAMRERGRDHFDPSDEIITTPFTFVATGEAVLRAGATPVFVDVRPDTLNIDPERIDAYLKEEARNAVGILPVHLYGQACDMEAIADIAERYGLFVLEDCAQALGGVFKGRKLAGLGDAGALSFFPSKNLGCYGDGGMIATCDGEIAEVSRALSQHGGKDKYRAELVGYNSRLDTLQAAVLLAKLPYLEEMLERRRRIAALYDRALRDIEGITVLTHPQGALPTYNQYTVLVGEGRRDELAEHLRERGIATAVYYPVPLHRMEAFRGRAKEHGGLEHSERACAQVLSLPVDPLLGGAEQEVIMEAVRRSMEP
ncbi:MAG: DegT/DnrJ/EryC1/StrS family aminotransferase [Actinomycetota bacterium]|nr:DegT/DnrJ/EryC1/StrS family aminotransferase [Actinomycetota bacterium]